MFLQFTHHKMAVNGTFDQMINNCTVRLPTVSFTMWVFDVVSRKMLIKHRQEDTYQENLLECKLFQGKLPRYLYFFCITILLVKYILKNLLNCCFAYCKHSFNSGD